MTITGKDIGGVLDALLASVDAESQEVFRKLADHPVMRAALSAVQNGRYEDFFFSLLYPIERAVDGLMASAIPGKTKAQFIFRHSRFLEAHLESVIIQREGHGCSHDKVRAIIGRLLRYYLTGQEISFDWAQPYTYSYPTTVFTTHEGIIEFFDGLYDLHYGKPTRYLAALHNVMKST